MKHFTILLLLIILPIFTNGQTIVNIQQATTLWYYTNTSPNTPSAYTWHEETNIKQGVHISVVPPEKTDIYLQQNNSWINFHTWNYGFMFELKVSYDGGSFITYFSDETRETSGWKNVPFTTLGKHTITLKWKSLALTTYYRSYDVYVVPQSQKFYKDNYGNTITCWEGNGEKKPIIVSEGFDAYDVSPAEFLRHSGGELFNTLLSNGHSIYIVNYIFNSQDIENNASVYHSASEYIGNITNSNDMIAVGVSMGGLIVRYALAKAEGNSDNLPFAQFISIDSPQQGAVMSKPLQDYIKENANSSFKKHGLNNTAAKQMLNYNTYGSLKTQFFNELNSLNNGNGYPTATKNIGISFSNGTVNPSDGKWLEVIVRGNVAPLPFDITLERKSFDLTTEEKVAGSYLPSYLVASSPSPTGTLFGWWTALGILPSGLAWIERFENTNPTFIPYSSSLDIVNNNSKFDTRIQADANYFHNQFPEAVVNALLSILLTPSATVSPTTYNVGSVKADTYVSGSFAITNTGGTTLNLTIQSSTAFDLDPSNSITYEPIIYRTISPVSSITVNYDGYMGGSVDYGPFTQTITINDNSNNIHKTHTVVGTLLLPDFCYGETQAMAASPEELLFDKAFVDFYVADTLQEETKIGEKKEKKSIKERLDFAYKLLKKDKTEKVENICKMIIDLYPESEMGISFYAMGLLWEASFSKETPDFNEKDFTRYLKELTERKEKYKINGYAQLILSLLDVGNDIEGLEKLFTAYEYDGLKELALFHQFIHYYIYKQDQETARKVSDQLDKMFVDSRYGYQAHLIF
ncbi:MAG: hypothetical protein ABIG69_19890, partial [Bacteroidota bacterium]